MFHFPQYWGVTVASSLFNAMVWGIVTVLVLPVPWGLTIAGLSFGVSFWIIAFLQNAERPAPSRMGIGINPYSPAPGDRRGAGSFVRET